MADEQRLDEVARLLADNHDVGRVSGARPSEGNTCDIELVLLSRVDGGYRLRSAVVDLDRLREVRGHLFAQTPSFPSEDLAFPTFLEAMRSAETLAMVSRADPILDLSRWQAGDKLVGCLTRSHVRSTIPWLPQPPRWWSITRRILTAAWYFVVGFLLLFPYPAPILVGVDDFLLGWVVVMLAVFLGVVLGILGGRTDGVLDRIERRLERTHTHPGDSATQPGSAVSPLSAPQIQLPATAALTVGATEDLEAHGGKSGPEDSDLELLAVVLGCTVGLGVLAAASDAAFGRGSLSVTTPGARDSLADNMLVLVALVGVIGLMGGLAYGVPALLWRLIRPIRFRPDPPTLRRYASPGPDVDDPNAPLPVPQRLRVRARTRNVSSVGWLSGAALWTAVGVVAQARTDEVGLTAFCIVTGLVLGVVGVLNLRRRLVADPTGITIHNFLRRVSIPWAEVRSIAFVSLHDMAADTAQPDSVRVPAGPNKLRFNERVTAEVPAGGSAPGEYLFTLRGTLWSMQRTYSPERGSLPAEPESADHLQGVQAAFQRESVKDAVPVPDARGSRRTAAPVGEGDMRRRQRRAILVAGLGVVVLVGVLAIAARSPYLDLPPSDIGVDPQFVLGRIRVATVVAVACLGYLVVAWRRAPQADGYDRALPPFWWIVGGAGIGVVGWLMFSDIQMDLLELPLWWSATYWGTLGAIVGWTCAIWGGGESVPGSAEDGVADQDDR